MLKKIITVFLFVIFSFSLLVSINGNNSFDAKNSTEGIATSQNNIATTFKNKTDSFDEEYLRANGFSLIGDTNKTKFFSLNNNISNTNANSLFLNRKAPNFFEKIKNFFIDLFSVNKNKTTNTTDNIETRTVFLGGNAIGFTIEGEGVVVVGISEVETPSGVEVPTKFSNLKEGDIIKKIEGVEINCGEKIGEIINSEEFINKTLNVEIVREGKVLYTTIKPSIDYLTNKYKLGLWIRDNSSGVGTLTFIEKNGDFAALGHPVSDIDTGTIMPIKNGCIYKSTIIGVNKGVRGVPGELKGMFVKGANSIGKIQVNNQNGIYGKLEQNSIQNYSNREIAVAKRNEVTPGKASIFACIDGSKVEEFEIEILKINNQVNSSDKNMIIRVCDKKLLEYTGGIVQGMSGSPIVQREKLVGCVTHVFINDPTKGFGIFIDTMSP